MPEDTLRLVTCILLPTLAVTTVCSSSGTAPATASAQCTPAQAATFAWWVGSWNYTVPGFDPGVTTVTATNGGCTLQEEFVDVGNQKAHTTIQFDSTSRQWKRTVTDPFRTYKSTGTIGPDGSIAFYETTTDRETYRQTDATHVHFSGESSSDGGKTWKLLFDATDTRRP